MSKPLAMWTVYRDMPGAQFVARKWVIEREKGAEAKQTDESLRFGTLHEVRQTMRAMHLLCIPRQPEDDPMIVETWL